MAGWQRERIFTIHYQDPPCDATALPRQSPFDRQPGHHKQLLRPGQGNAFEE